MRKLIIGLLAGLTAFSAAPALADDDDRRRYGRYERSHGGDRDRDGVPNRYDRRDDRLRGGSSDSDRDGIRDRYDRRDNRYDRYGNRRDRYYGRDQYGYGYGRDYNRGYAYGRRLNEREFFYFADRNRDGRLSRYERESAHRDLARRYRY